MSKKNISVKETWVLVGSCFHRLKRDLQTTNVVSDDPFKNRLKDSLETSNLKDYCHDLKEATK